MAGNRYNSGLLVEQENAFNVIFSGSGSPEAKTKVKEMALFSRMSAVKNRPVVPIVLNLFQAAVHEHIKGDAHICLWEVMR